MTSRERMTCAFSNKQPDMVPVSPDTSNMIPCRLTGKPFWDIYLYQDPPLWLAYINCVKHFGFDGWPHFHIELPEEVSEQEQERRAQTGRAIVRRTPDRLYVQNYRKSPQGRQWDNWVSVFPIDNPPWRMTCELAELPLVPDKWEEVEGVRPQPSGLELWEAIKREAGETGTRGITCGLPSVGNTEASIMRYFDDYDGLKRACLQQEEYTVAHVERILKLKPDHLMIGCSGIMTYEGPEIFRDLSLPTLQRVTKLARDAGIPSHLHACGKEKELVKIAVEETDLTSIEPLEAPPMGDCDLAEIKRLYGDRIALKGNLHTTDVMLRGTPEDVERACKWCIDVAAEGGGYVLATGDQCGRDTPDENILTMIEVARSYGKY